MIFQGTSKWYELQDLHVADILPQMITLSESYIQVAIICRMNIIISLPSAHGMNQWLYSIVRLLRPLDREVDCVIRN